LCHVHHLCVAPDRKPATKKPLTLMNQRLLEKLVVIGGITTKITRSINYR
jgi:hypothetical protein